MAGVLSFRAKNLIARSRRRLPTAGLRGLRL